METATGIHLHLQANRLNSIRHLDWKPGITETESFSILYNGDDIEDLAEYLRDQVVFLHGDPVVKELGSLNGHPCYQVEYFMVIE